MSEYGALQEWQGQGKTEALGQKRSPVPLCSPHPKQTGMGSNTSLRVGGYVTIEKFLIRGRALASVLCLMQMSFRSVRWKQRAVAYFKSLFQLGRTVKDIGQRKQISNEGLTDIKNKQVLSTIVLMLDVITSFNFLFFPNDGFKK
jgi:hypothetical protein